MKEGLKQLLWTIILLGIFGAFLGIIYHIGHVH